MGFLLIILQQSLQTVESMIMRRCSKKNGNDGFIFNAMIVFFAMLFSLVSDVNGIHFNKDILLYGLLGGPLYAAGFVLVFIALKEGSFILSSMICSFAIIFPIFYGTIFLNEKIGPLAIVGICLVFVSIVMSAMGKSKSNPTSGKISLKWFICIILAMMANGGITILIRVQQIAFNNESNNEFYTVCFAVAFLILAIIGLAKDGRRLGSILKRNTLYGVSTGCVNAFKNLIAPTIYLYLPISIASPLQTGFSQVAGFIISYFIYKERFTKLQLVSIALGIISLVLMNI